MRGPCSYCPLATAAQPGPSHTGLGGACSLASQPTCSSLHPSAEPLSSPSPHSAPGSPSCVQTHQGRNTALARSPHLLGRQPPVFPNRGGGTGETSFAQGPVSGNSPPVIFLFSYFPVHHLRSKGEAGKGLGFPQAEGPRRRPLSPMQPYPCLSDRN